MGATFAVAALMGITSSAHAQLLAYEGFNYPSLPDQTEIINNTTLFTTGSPNNGLGNALNATGAGDSTGWAAAWSTTAGTNYYQTAGLTYTDGSGNQLKVDGGSMLQGVPHSLVASGGQAAIGGYNINSTAANIQRALPTTFMNVGLTGNSNTLGALGSKNSQTIWLSYLWQDWVNDPLNGGGAAQMSFNFYANGTSTGLQGDGASSRAGTDIVDVGIGNTGTAEVNVPHNFTIGGIGANNFLTTFDASPVTGVNAKTYLIVMRLDVDNTSAVDMINLWENPTIGGAGPVGAPTVQYQTNISSVNAFRITAGNGNPGDNRTNGVQVMDELRLGNTFADVTPVVPEPSVIALAGVALSGMFLAIRRKRQS